MSPSEYNPNETNRDWETLQQNAETDKTQRLRIQGGWLYRTTTQNSTALVFVPIHSESTE